MWDGLEIRNRRNPTARNESAKNIDHPCPLIAPVRTPCKSTKTRIPKAVRLPIATTCCTSGIVKSLANQVIMLKPSATAPAMRVFIIPVIFVVRPRRERLRAGAKRKIAALIAERIAAIDVIVLYLMVCLRKSVWGGELNDQSMNLGTLYYDSNWVKNSPWVLR
jgi:hypothetical protein